MRGLEQHANADVRDIYVATNSGKSTVMLDRPSTCFYRFSDDYERLMSGACKATCPRALRSILDQARLHQCPQIEALAAAKLRTLGEAV